MTTPNETSPGEVPPNQEDPLPLIDVRPESESSSLVVRDRLSPNVQMIYSKDRKVRDLSWGVGKPPFDKDGQPQDCTSAGYDRSLLETLIKHGVTDPSDLATALHLRGDGEAREKGPQYIECCVRESLEAAAGPAEARAQVDFKVERIRLFDQKPTRYELTIEGQTFKITTGDLMSRSRFAHRFADEVRRIPVLPGKKEWPEFVNSLIARAERVEMPPEASMEPAKKDAIERIVAGLTTGSNIADLDNEKKIPVEAGPHAGKTAFKSRTVVKRMREEFPTVDSGEVCALLRDLGYQAFQITDDRVRVWGRTSENAHAGEKSEACDE